MKMKKVKSININSLSIVFPFFNEEQRIANSIKKIKNLFLHFKNFDLEVLLVNDGSTDKSDYILKEFFQSLSQKENKIFRYIKYNQNMGKGYACKQGVAKSKKNWILTCDIDFSSNPKELFIWSKKNYLTSTKECYFGSRRLSQSKVNYKFYRKFLGNIFTNVRKGLFNIDLQDTQCGFKLYPSKIGKFVFSKITQHGYIHDIEICILLKKNSIKINELPVKWQHVGSSKLNIFIDGIKMIYQLIKLKFKN